MNWKAFIEVQKKEYNFYKNSLMSFTFLIFQEAPKKFLKIKVKKFMTRKTFKTNFPNFRKKI